MTTCASPASMSMTLPLPSSPHWPPTTARTGILPPSGAIARELYGQAKPVTGGSVRPGALRRKFLRTARISRGLLACRVVLTVVFTETGVLQRAPPGFVLDVPAHRPLHRRGKAPQGGPAERPD